MTDIATLRAHLARNRFLPVPPPDAVFCGDGDFRAIGAEFLAHLVEHAGLTPTDRVLDIGCGIGRLALPLTQYLDDTATYTGIDPVRTGIDWCNTHIAPLYPNFTFHHLDVHHPLYNPTATTSTSAHPIPFAHSSFDLICLVSVLTHLDETDLLFYAAEAARLLAPGGRVFATAFLVNPPARDAMAQGLGHLPFDRTQPGPVFFANPAAPLAAVAFDEDAFLEKFLRHGLHRREPTQYGHWSGRDTPAFQDLCVFARAA